jgi:hypothetical protein
MITVNLDQAKQITYALCQLRHQEALAPILEAVRKQLPGTDFDNIVEQQPAIDRYYLEIIENIDQAETIDQLSIIVNQLNNNNF